MSSSGAVHGPSLRQRLWSAVADVVTVLVFVAVGRRNHDEDVDASGVLEVAAPFLIAVILMWAMLTVLQRRRRPVDAGWGVSVWVGTVAIGMVLRRFVFDDGTATAFVIVATIFLGVVLNGWRGIARWAMHRRANAVASDAA